MHCETTRTVNHLWIITTDHWLHSPCERSSPAAEAVKRLEGLSEELATPPPVNTSPQLSLYTSSAIPQQHQHYTTITTMTTVRTTLMACSDCKRGRDKTVLSCRQLCSHRGQDSIVLSWPSFDEFVSCGPSFQFASNSLFTPPTQTRQNCLVLSSLQLCS